MSDENEKSEAMPTDSSRTDTIPTVRVIKPQTAGDRLYGEGALRENGYYGAILKPSLEKLADQHLLSSDQINKIRTEEGKFFQELNMDRHAAARINDIFIEHVTKPADEETRAKWRTETNTKLRAAYGDEAKERALLARGYLKTKGSDQPFTKAGIDYHPDVFLEIVDKVWQLKRDGNLKISKG